MTYLLRLSLETLYVNARARARLLQSLDKDIKQIKFERTHTFLFIVFRHAYQRVTRFLSVSSHFSLFLFFLSPPVSALSSMRKSSSLLFFIIVFNKKDFFLSLSNVAFNI